MIISEIFYSIQGEGLLAGTPSVFIRIAGCPIRCTFCDTQYALDPSAGQDLTISQILDKIENMASPSSHERRATSHVVITGGEPMVNPQLPQLAAELKKLDKHITIETAGIKFIPEILCDLMSISPKTSNAKIATPLLYSESVRRLIKHHPYQLKFVVDSPDDLPEIQKFVSGLKDVDPTRVMLMPQAKTRNELLAKSPMVADLCKQTGFVFCNRLQIQLWDKKKGV